MLDRIKSNKLLILTLLLILLLAVGVRVGIICNEPRIYPEEGIMTPIGEAARNLVEGRGYVIDEQYVASIVELIINEQKLFDIQDVPPPENEQFTPYHGIPPGPSVLLAGTYWAFGEYRYIYLRVIQAIITSFGCLLMFLIGRELFSRRIGLIAAFLYAIYLPIAYLSTWPLHDALMPFITLVSLYFFIKAVQTKAIKFYILSALVIGISCYFQPSTFLLPLFFGLGLFIYNLGKSNFREHIANAAKVTAIMMAVLVLVLSPWIARNYYVTGKVMVLMRSSGPWQGMWEGFGEFGENPVGAVFSDELTYEMVKEELGYDVEYQSPEFEEHLKGKVLNTIKEHPVWWLSILARRVPLTIVYPSEVGIQHYPRDNEGNVLWDEYSRENPGIAQFMTLVEDGTLWEYMFWDYIQIYPYGAFVRMLIALFAVVPFLLSIAAFWIERRNWRKLVLVAILPVYFSAVHMMIFFAFLFKSVLPGSLAYIIFSAIALDYFYRRIIIDSHSKSMQ